MITGVSPGNSRNGAFMIHSSSNRGESGGNTNNGMSSRAQPQHINPPMGMHDTRNMRDNRQRYLN